jgi:hypothetical protein
MCLFKEVADQRGAKTVETEFVWQETLADCLYVAYLYFYDRRYDTHSWFRARPKTRIAVTCGHIFEHGKTFRGLHLLFIFSLQYFL